MKDVYGTYKLSIVICHIIDQANEIISIPSCNVNVHELVN